MSKVVYEVLQKPIEERIIDAACIYWGIERPELLQSVKQGEVMYRKAIVYYLIRNNTTYTARFIAKKFGAKSHGPVLRLIDNIDSQKDVYKQYFNDLNQIQHLADKLDANFIQYDIQLINNKLEIKNS